MKVKQILEQRPDLTLEAIASQVPGITLDSELPPELTQVLLEERGTGRAKQLKSAQIQEDLEDFSKSGKIDSIALCTIAEYHDVSLRFVLEVAETLNLYKLEMGYLRGFVQQEEIHAAEMLGRKHSAMSKLTAEHKQLAEEREAIARNLFHKNLLESRLGIKFNDIEQAAASQEKKFQASTDPLKTMVLAQLNPQVK